MKYFLLLILLSGCPTPSDIDNNGNVLGVPGNSAQQQQCADSEKNMLSLNCKDQEGLILGGKNRNGETFNITCQQLLVHNIPVKTTCLTSAKTCDELKKCE